MHPANFGVMPSADNVPIFGVNHFDEAHYAPFTWDLKRGAVGFLLAAEEEGGHGPSRQRAIARHFLQGYVDAIDGFARDGTEDDHQVRPDNAPELIRRLFDDASQDRRSWLAEDYHDEYGRGFRADEELVPATSRRAEFQSLVDRVVADGDIAVPTRAGEMRVKDVAARVGQGTASLGLTRYYVLVEGARADATDDLILDFKQARRSALAGLTPPSEYDSDGRGERIARAQRTSSRRSSRPSASRSLRRRRPAVRRGGSRPAARRSRALPGRPRPRCVPDDGGGRPAVGLSLVIVPAAGLTGLRAGVTASDQDLRGLQAARQVVRPRPVEPPRCPVRPRRSE